MSQILMKSARLCGRELTMDDLDAFIDLPSNPKVMQHVGRAPMTPEECRADLEKLLNHYRANDGFNVWGFFSLNSDEMVGTGAIVSDKKGNELGFRVREKFWGNGFGVEIANALLKYGFEHLKMSSIFAEVDQINTPSVKVLDKTMSNKRAFWNEAFNSNDYYYEISKEAYEKISH